MTEIVSSTGALIRAEEPALPAPSVRVVIELPSVAGCLIGFGRIVPTAEAGAHSAAGTFAIAVGHFHIRSKAVLDRII